MEPLVPPDVRPSTTSDPRDSIDDLLAGRVERADIDVRTFLLDPPPTEDELARTQRRQLLVRRGSVAAAAIIAVLLVAPWPGAGHEEPHAAPASPAATDGDVGVLEPTELTAPGASTATPVRALRLDTPVVTAPRASRRSSASRSTPRASRPAPSTPRAASARPGTVHAPATAAPRPAPSPPAAPASSPTPAPTPSGDAILAPVA